MVSIVKVASLLLIGIILCRYIFKDDEDIEHVESIKPLISIINVKDRYTYSHVESVVIYSRLLVDKLNLSEIDKNTVIYGAYMHDI